MEGGKDKAGGVLSAWQMHLDIFLSVIGASWFLVPRRLYPLPQFLPPYTGLGQKPGGPERELPWSLALSFPPPRLPFQLHTGTTSEAS